MVRRQRRGNLRRRAGDQDRDLALEIEPGKIVEVIFRDAQAVTDKHQGSFDFGARSTRVLKIASSPRVSGSALPSRTRAALDSCSTNCRDTNFTGW